MTGISIMGRCFTLLECLAERPEGMSLGALSDQTGMPKSATHRMLASLVDTGFVTQSEDTRDYRLTMKLVTLGFRFLGQTGLIDHCQDVLDRLAKKVQELVRLTVVDGERLVFVAKSQGATGSLVIDPIMGRDVVLHATANGKVWLASLTTEQALQLVLRRGFGDSHEHGPNVIQSVEVLLSELEKTRKQGYGMVWEEAEVGVAAIAVGIRVSPEKDAPLVGTLSVAGPVFRLSKTRLKEFLPDLQKAEEELYSIGSILKYWRHHHTYLDKGQLVRVVGEL